MPKWFPEAPSSLTEGNLVSNFQISADNNIVFIGNKLVNSGLESRLKTADKLDRLFNLAEPAAEIATLMTYQRGRCGISAM